MNSLRRIGPEPRRVALLLLWILSTLLIAHFHEPWRDEAQAWLVARSASSLPQLLYRASLEATGPLYYLWLWPWARAFPGAFPAAIFWLSWTGSLCAVALLLQQRRGPLWPWALVAFGYLFGFEYAVVARLYGWGCFFLLAGLFADLRERPLRASLWLGAACLVQLNFVFAAAAWIALRLIGARSPPELWGLARPYIPLAAALVLAWLHLKMAAGERGWEHWSFDPSLKKIGSTALMPFLQSPGKIGRAGLLLLPFVFLALPRARERLAFCAGYLPFLAILLARYDGIPMSRHGGPLFLVWLIMAFSAGALERAGPRRILAVCLGLSLLSGLEARMHEIRANYSDGLPAAEKMREVAAGREPKVFVQEDLYGFVIAARLNRPLFTGMNFVRVDYPALTRERRERIQAEFKRLPWEAYARHCSHEREACFVVTRPMNEPPPPAVARDFSVVYSPTQTMSDESLLVYAYTPVKP